MVYQHPLAYLIGMEGLALLRAWAGDYDYDREFVTARLAETRKLLDDDQGRFPAQNIAPIITAALLEAYGDDLTAAINELSAMITTDDLLAWNTETDIEFRESDEVATEWLESKGLL